MISGGGEGTIVGAQKREIEMLERLEEIAKRHEELLAQQADPVVAVDQNLSREVPQKLAELQPVVTAYHQYTTTANELEGAREIVAEADDDEMREMAEAEVGELRSRLEEIEQRLKLLLLPADHRHRHRRRTHLPDHCRHCPKFLGYTLFSDG